jgi:hypothetical protein
MTVGYGTPMVSVSCSSSSFCVALGIPPASGHPAVPSCTCATAFTYLNGKWSSGLIVDRHTYQDSISCPSSEFCLAVDSLPGISPQGYQGGYAFTYDNGVWSSPVRVDPGSLGSVSCSTVSFCVATGAVDGSVYTYSNGQWSTRFELPGASTVQVFSVSCTARMFCMAIGLPGGNFGVGWYSTYQDGRWSPGSTLELAPHTFLQGVSCASTTLCVAVDQSGNAYLYTDGWAAGQKVTTATETPSVSCQSTSTCFVSGNNDVAALLGNKWSRTLSVPDVNLRYLTCASATFCVAVGDSANGRPNAFVYSVS